jgi:hypothetical protein
MLLFCLKKVTFLVAVVVASLDKIIKSADEVPVILAIVVPAGIPDGVAPTRAAMIC